MAVDLVNAPVPRRNGGNPRLNAVLPKPIAAAPVNAVAATRVLNMATQPTAGDTITIGSRTYTFRAAGTADEAGEVNLGANVAATKPLLVAAINGDANNSAHPDVTAAAFISNAMTITAKRKGAAANAIATTETFTDGTDAWAGATMTGGVDGTPGEPSEMGLHNGYLYINNSESNLGVQNDAWYRVQLTLVS